MKYMARRWGEQIPKPRLQKIERQLDKARTPAWEECPPWVKRISPLTRFITTPELRAALLQEGAEFECRQSGGDAVSDESIVRLRDRALQLIEDKARQEREGSKRKNPYHNADHDRQVVERLTLLISTSTPRLSTQQAETVLTAGAFHDADHPGGTAKLRTEDGKSYEQHAGENADRYARAAGFTLRQRLDLGCTIIGTTFGDDAVQPVTQLETMAKLADVGGYMRSRAECITQGLQVAEEYAQEDPPLEMIHPWLYASDLDTSIREWLQWQQEFLRTQVEPLHRTYKRRYVNVAGERVRHPQWRWFPDIALSETQQMLQILMTNVQAPEYAELMAEVRQKLEYIRTLYGRR